MTDKKRKSFVLHIDSLDILDDLDNDQVAMLFRAIKDYQNGVEPELDVITKMVFLPFKNQFNRDDEKYKTVCNRRKIAGSKGGKAKVANASNCKQELANKANLADSDSKNKSDSDNKSKSKSKSNIVANATCENDKHCSPRQVVDLYNDVFSGMYPRQMRELTANRASTIRARIKNDISDIEEWTQFFEWLKESDFLMGRVNTPNRKPFQLSLDWICKAENMANILEQKYHG
jgi:hypothetical protein